MIAVGVLAGFGLEIFAVSWITTVQERIPDEMLARVSSYDALGSFVFIPVGLVLAGPAADALGVSGALWVAAGVSLATILGALASRDVRRLRRLPVTTRRTGPVPEPVVPRAR
jgi:MFS family permease